MFFLLISSLFILMNKEMMFPIVQVIFIYKVLMKIVLIIDSFLINILLIRLTVFKMQVDQCLNCYSSFDYQKKAATTICESNHNVCRQCADKLYKSKSKCPLCLSPLLVVIPQSIRQSQDNKNCQQLLSVGPQNDSPIVQLLQPANTFQLPNLRGLIFSKNFLRIIFSFLLSATCIIIRMKMNYCQFWDYISCVDSQNIQICCPYTSSCSWETCSSINQIAQNSKFLTIICWIYVVSTLAMILSVGSYFRGKFGTCFTCFMCFMTPYSVTFFTFPPMQQ